MARVDFLRDRNKSNFDRGSKIDQIYTAVQKSWHPILFNKTFLMNISLITTALLNQNKNIF